MEVEKQKGKFGVIIIKRALDIKTSVLTGFSYKELTIITNISALETEIIGLTNNSTINRNILCVARLPTVGDWQYLNDNVRIIELVMAHVLKSFSYERTDYY